MSKIKEDFKSLPAVDKLLGLPEVRLLAERYGKELVTFSIRHSIDYFRSAIRQGNPPPTTTDILKNVQSLIDLCGNRSLKKVLNATGIIIHTNLGRAPFGENLLKDSYEILEGYNNLEFDLKTGNRGNRNVHASELVKFLTGAEDVLIVNNNAAAVMLILRAFAKDREVVISRGELIEIGGSFRIPDIMAASDCKMIEVGTTNKTNIKDYRKAIGKNTSALFKAHKSNYVIKGFTEEVELDELVQLAKEINIPFIYDIGSGLLKNIDNPLFRNEPDIKRCIEKGIDMVCFSGDKLLGGPQAGIIVGKKKWIDKLRNEPMFRALRVCKTTLALLETTCMYYLSEKTLIEKSFIHQIFNRKPEEIKKTAEALKTLLEQQGIQAEIVPSKGQCGGGTLPDAEIESFTVNIRYISTNKERSGYAEKMYHGLLSHSKPVLGIIKKGTICFDVLTILEKDIQELAQTISKVNNSIESSSKNIQSI